MNLYCTQENQQLLWNTVSKIPQFQKLRRENAPACESLFKAVIEEHYHEIGPRRIEVSELRTWNKKSIQKVIESLRQNQQNKQNKHMPSQSTRFLPDTNTASTTTPIFSLESNTTQTRSHLLEEKQNALNSQFQKRQDEYSQFLKKPQVEEIDFREKDESDGPLDNVDSLLQHHMKEREYEHFVPPPTAPQQQEQQQNTNEIMKEMQGTIEAMQGTIEAMQGTIEGMQSKMDTMQGTIEAMQSKMDTMQEEIKALKDDHQEYTFRANSIDEHHEEEEEDEEEEEEEEEEDEKQILEREVHPTQTE